MKQYFTVRRNNLFLFIYFTKSLHLQKNMSEADFINTFLIACLMTDNSQIIVIR